MEGHAKKAFRGIIFQFQNTPMKERNKIYDTLFVKNKECLYYEKENKFILAYYSHCYIAAQIMETCNNHYYSISHYLDRKTRHREPNMLKIFNNSEQFILRTVRQHNGIILEEREPHVIVYFPSFKKTAEVLTVLKNYKIEATFAKTREVMHLKDMFEFLA